MPIVVVKQKQELKRTDRFLPNLQKEKDKEDILKNSKRLRDTNIFIRETFSDKVEQKRKELWPKVLEHSQQGKIAYLSVDKLIVRNKPI